MSPKSRGRKGKGKGKRKGAPRQQARPGYVAFDPSTIAVRPNPFSDSTSDPFRDYLATIAEDDATFRRVMEWVLEGSADLLGTAGPRQLEQGTAELLASVLATREARELQTDLLLHDLAEVARNRVLSDIAWNKETWRGPWWLLHGLASIGPFGHGHYAAEQMAATKVPQGEPDWLGLLPRVSLSGEVFELRDNWGLRIGVIAEFGYPNGVDPHVYLVDIDASWYITITTAGVFDDTAAAETAWRASLPRGESAGEIQPISENAIAVLYEAEHQEELMSLDNLLTEHYRAPRRINDILTKLASRRAKRSPETSADEFIGWYRAKHGGDPDVDLATSFAEEWTLTVPSGTAHLMSPRRAVGFYEHFINTFVVDDTDDLQLVMPEWIRWLGEKADIDTEVIEASVEALLHG